MTRRIFATVLVSGLLAFAATPAFAENQPSQGVQSALNRNEAGFGGGPHCHLLSVDQSQQEQFDPIVVFPSHQAHVSSGLPDRIFVADPDCNGLP